MSEVVYICDGNACNYKTTYCTPSCKLDKDKAVYGRCLHTTDPLYAKFGVCKDPENHPERFKKLENGEFWEIEKDMNHG